MGLESFFDPGGKMEKALVRNALHSYITPCPGVMIRGVKNCKEIGGKHE